MARNKVMKLWNAIVTAFLALCTALGLITTTASAAVPQTDKTRNSDSTPNVSAPTTSLRPRPVARALTPTMKQRIHAEAHGKSPSCRHRPAADTTAESDSADCSDDTTSTRAEPATGRIPLQR
jgi:hypothetical protein